MKFLIAIKNTKEESKNILEIGCKIAEGFSADLIICYIGKQSKALIEGDVILPGKPFQNGIFIIPDWKFWNGH